MKKKYSQEMKKNILVIEDDQSILEAMKFTLEYAGYDVITSKNGAYAEKLKNKDHILPDLILLDVLLSGNDGRIICKKLKSHKNTETIPVIMVSAHPGAEKSVKEFGADDFLAKPFSIDDLLDKVKNQLSLKQ